MEYAKNYYQCDTLGGVFLEDSSRYDYACVQSTTTIYLSVRSTVVSFSVCLSEVIAYILYACSHWDTRVLLPELMTGQFYP